jgi:hypothetical protein
MNPEFHYPLTRPVVAGPNHMSELTLGQTFGPIIDAYRKAPKMRPIDTEDQEVIRAVKHTMRKGEKLIQWYARVGLGKSQILRMTKDEISRVVAQAEINRKEEALPPREAYEPKRIPARITLVDTDSL